MPRTRIHIDGERFHDIPTFYDEINRIFMEDEDWKIGQSLDALNDVLHGGFGPIRGAEELDLIWRNFEKSRSDLGYDAMHRHLSAKLDQPTRFNIAKIQQDLENLERAGHPTYFDIILEIIADHPNIRLIEE